MESFIGNTDLLNKSKTAFLCSRQVESTAVMRCYDWATEQQGKDVCVISGFQSPIEKDVLHFLLRCRIPVIMVLGRKMYSTLPSDLQQALDDNRLLIISTSDASRQSASTIRQRNLYILHHSDQIVFGHITPNGTLAHLAQEAKQLNKPIINLSV